MQTSKTEIFRIIGEYLNGESLSKKDRETLDNWLSSSKTNQNIFKKSEELFLSGKDLKFLDEVNIDKAWNKLKKRTTEKRRILKHPLLRYAAVLLPLIGLSFFLLFFLSQKRENYLNYAAMDRIHAGKSLAKLTLSDGQTITLGGESKIISKTPHLTIQCDSLGKLEYKNRDCQEPEYNTLYVPKAGEYKLVLSDGTKVWFNSNSRLKYPTVFTGENRSVYLEGEAYFEVAKNTKMPFLVNIKDKANVKVLGTHFNIKAYEDENTIKTSLLEGSVAVSLHDTLQNNLPFEAHQSITLIPGQQATIDASGQLSVEKVDTDGIISWKKGLFIFNKISLEDLSTTINRWYDVEVLFTDASVKEQFFTGAIEKQRSLKFIVQLLEETNSVKCTLNDSILYIE